MNRMQGRELFSRYKEDIIETVKELVAFPSVDNGPEGDAPFGKAVNDALHYMLDKAKTDGFDICNADDRGGHIELKGRSDETIAMVNHLDVVPAGDLTNWESDPFKAEVRNGRLYGRGVLDNKGPLALCYYAMKALKDSGTVPGKTVRLILGCDEETHWDGMDYYLANTPGRITGGFSADADFPVIHGEKGIVQYNIHVPLDQEASRELKELKGGTVMNAVPDEALAVFEYKGDEGRLGVKGKTAHAAWPDKGINAVTRLCALLKDIEFRSDKLNRFFGFFAEHIGTEINGEKAGCGFSDAPSGKLTFNVSRIEKTESEIIAGVDIRFPVTFSENDVRSGLGSVLEKEGYTLETVKVQDPLYVPVDDPLVTTLMKVYKEHTGDDAAVPIVIGGGTYARAVPNTVAFGPVMPGTDDLCHLPNEYMELSQMETAFGIFTDALYELAAE